MQSGFIGFCQARKGIANQKEKSTVTVERRNFGLVYTGKFCCTKTQLLLIDWTAAFSWND